MSLFVMMSSLVVAVVSMIGHAGAQSVDRGEQALRPVLDMCRDKPTLTEVMHCEYDLRVKFAKDDIDIDTVMVFAILRVLNAEEVDAGRMTVDQFNQNSMADFVKARKDWHDRAKIRAGAIRAAAKPSKSVSPSSICHLRPAT